MKYSKGQAVELLTTDENFFDLRTLNDFSFFNFLLGCLFHFDGE